MAMTQLVIEDFEGTRTVVPLDMDSLTIGRGTGHLIQLTEQNVSRDHAKLYLVDEGWVVEDLGSFNGVNVNNVEVTGAVMLREGDIITVGDYVMQLAGDSSRDTVELLGAGVATDSYEAPIARAVTPTPRMSSTAVEEAEPAPAEAENAPSEIQDKSTPLEGMKVAAPARVDDGLNEFEFDEVGAGNKKIVLVLIFLGTLAAAWYWWQSRDEGVTPSKKSVVAKVEKPESKDMEPEADASEKDAVVAGETGTEGEEQPPEDEPEPALVEPVEPSPAPVVAPRPTNRTVASRPARKKSASKPAATKPAASTTESAEPEVQQPTPSVQEPVPVARPKTASELLAQGRKAAMLGKASLAYDLAQQSNTKSPSADAVQLMAVSACKMGSESKAKAAFSRLSEKKKKSVRSLCESKGISL